MKKFRLVLLVGVLSVVGLKSSGDTKDKDACTLDGATDNCSIFKGDNDRFPLPDGTFIPNFSAIARAENTKRNSTKTAEMEGAVLGYLNQIRPMREEIRSVLRSKGMDDDFDLATLNFVFSEPKASDPAIVPISWPLVNPTHVEYQSPEAIRAAFKANLTGDSYARIDNLLARARQLAPGTFPLIRDLNAVTEKRKKTVSDLVGDVQERILKVICQGRCTDDDKENQKVLSKEEWISYQKVKDVRLDMSQFDQLRNHPNCTGLIPNAFYDPGDHSINICPNFYNYPDSTLVAVLAHEMYHPNDPCNSQFALYKYDNKAMAAVANSPELNNDDDNFNLYQDLKGNDGNYTASPFSLYAKDGAVKYMENANILTKVADGIPRNKYPLSDVYNCLVGKKFRPTDPAIIKKMADEIVENRVQEFETNYKPKEDKSRIVETFGEFPECLGTDKHSQMGEAMADWMGGEVLGSYLKDHPPKTEYEKLAPVAYFAGVTCLTRQEAKRYISGEKGRIGIIQAALSDYASVNDAHPSSKKRLDDIYLQNPDTRTALHCDPNSSGCRHNASGVKQSKPTQRGQ